MAELSAGGSAVGARTLVVAPAREVTVALVAIPLMFAARYTGYRLDKTVSPRGHGRLHWAVMAGYTIRFSLRI